MIRLCQDGSTDRPRPLAAPAPGAARGSPGWGPQAARGVPEPSWEYRLPRDHRGTAQTADFPSGRLLRGAAAAAGRWAEGADGPLAPGLPGAGAAAPRPLGSLGLGPPPLVDQSRPGCCCPSRVSLRTAEMLSKGNLQEENVPEVFTSGRLGFARARAGRAERPEDGPADSARPAALISRPFLLSL